MKSVMVFDPHDTQQKHYENGKHGMNINARWKENI